MIAVYLVVIAQIVLLTAAMDPAAQECIICGGSVVRLWSVHSHVGDRYLRIVPDENTTFNSTNVKVDFGGVVDIDDNDDTNVDALVQFEDVSTGFPNFETRVRIRFYHDNTRYYLKVQGVHDELTAISEHLVGGITDESDIFYPIRLIFEYDPYYLFESVKHKDYYLATNGEAQTKLISTPNEFHRDAETLIHIVDPGQEIAGASFGGSGTSSRKKRAVTFQKTLSAVKSLKTITRAIKDLFPGRAYGKKEVSILSRSELRKVESQMRSSLIIPELSTFTLCFWIRTKDDEAQVFSLVYDKINNRPTISVEIKRGALVLTVRGKTMSFEDCHVNDGKWHHVCASLQRTSRLHIYQDGKSVHQSELSIPKTGSSKRRAYVYLGKTPGTGVETLRGDLTQVNVWDDYPLFRIERIATNPACGGGNVIEWNQILAVTTTSRDVGLYRCDDCPRHIGSRFNKRRQNNLV